MIKDIFAIFGFFSIGVVVFALLRFLCKFIKESIEEAKYKHKVKHRYDNPPTAKCYCKDCVAHQYDNSCSQFEGWKTADHWFCWNATPRTKKMEEEVKA